MPLKIFKRDKVFLAFAYADVHDDPTMYYRIRDLVLSEMNGYYFDGSFFMEERFDTTIEREIREANIFILFWTDSAARSLNLKKQWQYALSLDRPNFIRILPPRNFFETPIPAELIGERIIPSYDFSDDSGLEQYILELLGRESNLVESHDRGKSDQFIITSTLYDQIQRILFAEIERLKAQERNADYHQSDSPSPENNLVLSEVSKIHSEIEKLQILSQSLDEQRIQTRNEFREIEKRDKTSSRQSLWLTIIGSFISLIIGWFLSLIGSPSTLIKFFGH